MAAIHGIDDAMAAAHGIPEAEALEGFTSLASRAGLRVAHNESFDARILRIAHRRFSPDDVQMVWQNGKAYCTCQSAKNHVALPPTAKMVAKGMKTYKPPSLAESLMHFTGETLTNAHRARPDTEACARVYWALLDATREPA